MDEDFLTAPQVAKMLRVTSASINNWCKEGLFPGAYKINPTRPKSRWRIPHGAVDLFKQKRHEQYGWVKLPLAERVADEVAVLD
jgi:predicted DNA-binding transcriptional regulator AlpA